MEGAKGTYSLVKNMSSLGYTGSIPSTDQKKYIIVMKNNIRPGQAWQLQL